MWHFANVFEDGDDVVVDFPQWSAPGLGLQGNTPVTGRFVRAALHRSSGTVNVTEIEGTPSEFPRIDDRRLGRSYRYAVVAARSPEARLTDGEHDVLLRHDLVTGHSERIATGAAIGEVVFGRATVQRTSSTGTT